jgi:L-fuculose-phosphate aldolase
MLTYQGPSRGRRNGANNCIRSGTQTDLPRELVKFGKRLYARGLVAATDGNLSVRLDNASIIITPTGVSKGAMRPADMVVVDLNGRKLSGARNASSEMDMHLTIYRMRSDIKAIVHAHPCTATAFASAGIAFEEPLCSEAVITLGCVPLAPYAAPGSAQLGKSLEPFIEGHDAILMANHGVVTYGNELCRAYMMMEAVEHYARIVLTARQLGAAQWLSRDDTTKLLQIRKKYLANSAG